MIILDTVNSAVVYHSQACGLGSGLQIHLESGKKMKTFCQMAKVTEKLQENNFSKRNLLLIMFALLWGISAITYCASQTY